MNFIAESPEDVTSWLDGKYERPLKTIKRKASTILNLFLKRSNVHYVFTVLFYVVW